MQRSRTSRVRAFQLVTGLLVAATATAGLLTFSPHASAKDGDNPAQIALPNGWRPEGVTAGDNNTLYMGSLETGAIWKADAKTGEGAILTPGAPGRISVGLDFDERNERLWVAGGPTGALRVVDANSGEILQTYQSPIPGFLNDVAVTREAVYVSNSNAAAVVVIPTPRDGTLPDPSVVTTLPLSGDYKQVGGFNVNGIVSSKGYLIIVQTATGTLFRVDPATGDAKKIDLGAYSVTFGDGLEVNDDTLYVVRNRANLVAKIELAGDRLSGSLVSEITDPALDVPTTAALQRGALYAVNARFGTPNANTTATYAAIRLPK